MPEWLDKRNNRNSLTLCEFRSGMGVIALVNLRTNSKHNIAGVNGVEIWTAAAREGQAGGNGK
jgi:hypothetical protein